MQPTLVQVPPGAGLPSAVFQSSTHAVLPPSCAARIAAVYPPGPAPIITTSNASDMLVSSHPNELYTNDLQSVDPVSSFPRKILWFVSSGLNTWGNEFLSI